MEYDLCTLDEVTTALAFVPAFDQETWVQMGMAVKSEFGDGGFDTWDCWSQTADNYDAKAARTRWKSFKAGRGITIATLFKVAINNGYRRDKTELTAAEKTEREKLRKARAAKRKQEAALAAEQQARWYAAIAQGSAQLVKLLKKTGRSPYLGRKKINACGALFVPHGIIIQFLDGPERVELITGKADISGFFDGRAGDESFRYIKPGDLLIPMQRVGGELAALQIIYAKEKTFFPEAPKSGLSFLIGELSPGQPLVFVEGFATGASVHMATGWPVVVCFDAGNVPVVAKLYREAYPTQQFIFAADNDRFTEGNPGVAKAQEAANETAGVVWVPQFEVAA